MGSLIIPAQFAGFPRPGLYSAMGPEHYQSYTINAPLRSHWRPATCEEYECDGWLYGMVLPCDLSTDLGVRQADYLRHDKTRSFREERLNMTMTQFVYGPGNRCFKNVGETAHRVPIGRPPNLLVVGGDWRGNPRRSLVRHTRVEYWVEDFAEHQSKLAQTAQRG